MRGCVSTRSFRALGLGNHAAFRPHAWDWLPNHAYRIFRIGVQRRAGMGDGVSDKFCSRERRAKGSCCVGLPLGPSCLSRGAAGALPGRCRSIGNLDFSRKIKVFRLGAWAQGPGLPWTSSAPLGAPQVGLLGSHLGSLWAFWVPWCPSGTLWPPHGPLFVDIDSAGFGNGPALGPLFVKAVSAGFGNGLVHGTTIC